MVDQHPFFFEVLARVDNNIFPFQQHLKATCDLLLPATRVCLLPFEQLIKQQMVHLQDSILKHLHHHILSNMLSDKILEAHRARNFIMFWPWGKCLACSSINLPNLSIIFSNFFHIALNIV
jgi:hypothetical protein